MDDSIHKFSHEKCKLHIHKFSKNVNFPFYEIKFFSFLTKLFANKIYANEFIFFLQARWEYFQKIKLLFLKSVNIMSSWEGKKGFVYFGHIL
jgi:hypothetical protein